MGLDPIDDGLQQLEGAVANLPPAAATWLRDRLEELRYCWEVWRKEPVQPSPVRAAVQPHDDLYRRARQLAIDLHTSLQPWKLPASWSGPMADEYLGHPVHLAPRELRALQYEGVAPDELHDGAGWEMWRALDTLGEVLDYNGAAHRQAGDHYQHVLDLHNDLDFTLKSTVAELVATIVTAVIPVVDLLSVVEAAGTAYSIGRCLWLAKRIRDFLEAFRVVKALEMAYKVSRWVRVAVLLADATGLSLTALAGIRLIEFLFAAPVSPFTYPQQNPYPTAPPLVDPNNKRYQELLQWLRTNNPDHLPDDVLQMLASTLLPEDDLRRLMADLEGATIERIYANNGGAETARIIMLNLNALLTYFRARGGDIAGVLRLAHYLSSDNDIQRRGAYFALVWDGAHLHLIAAIEAGAGNDQQEDVLLLNGDVVELKSFNFALWNTYLIKVAEIKDLKAQLAKDHNERHPDAKVITFVFNSQPEEQFQPGSLDGKMSWNDIMTFIQDDLTKYSIDQWGANPDGSPKVKVVVQWWPEQPIQPGP